MNVVSLFDGMGIGLLSLIRAGMRNFTYYRVEIDPSVNKAFQEYYTERKLSSYGIKVIHFHDVRTFPEEPVLSSLQKEDLYLLMGGSPCQGFSIAGNQLNFNDPRSKLFFDFLRIKELLSPSYFLLENVKMKKEFSDVIDKYLGPHREIDSALFTAQSRKRFYWTNIPCSTSFHSNTDTVESILEDSVDDTYFIEPKRTVVLCDNECRKHKIAYIGSDSAANRIYSINGKSVTLVANGGGLGAKTGLYAIPCMGRFKPPLSKFYTFNTKDLHGTRVENYIRKLTPVECERLQGWEDNMTIGAGKYTARYKICGNGWTEPVIRHILKNII